MASLTKIYQNSFRTNFMLPAVTDYGSDTTLTYGEFAKKIARIHLLYESCGVKKGDKIALMGKNTPDWVAVFMATITYGAVIVPVLQDFNPRDAQHIINHSDAVLLFISEHIYEHMDFNELPNVKAAVSLDRRVVLDEISDGKRKGVFSSSLRGLTRRINNKYPTGFAGNDIVYADMDLDDVAVINYTSGTTDFSKGVMLTYGNLLGNVMFGIESGLHYQGSRALSFLPLAHAYGCAFDMLVPLAVGSHVTLLGKIPSPQILMRAFARVKPSLIICVPLILEKIYRKLIVPMITTRAMRWVLAVPGLDRAIYMRIKARLVEAFGGEFEEVIVGGAPLNPEVEDFLHKIKFPFTVGYGMTECGPLISYTPWQEFIPGSSGATLPGIMQARTVRPEDAPEDAPGEILVKGQNVMKGYYKNPEATADVLDAEGWLRTGDMGFIGGPGDTTIFIRGRYKTMLLSANGQNIYPEEIEAKLNNMPYVGESLVVERNGRLTALVYPDMEALDRDKLTVASLEPIMAQTRVELNRLLAPYEQIEKIQLIPEEFEKTPKRSIKRFLYS